MIRRFVLPAEQTAELLKRGLAAGEGAQLITFPHATKDGTGMTLSHDIRSADRVNAADEDCDEPINSSHVCPGPLCP